MKLANKALKHFKNLANSPFNQYENESRKDQYDSQVDMLEKNGPYRYFSEACACWHQFPRYCLSQAEQYRSIHIHSQLSSEKEKFGD